MKNKEIQRPRNMSQLDYLWTTYGSYKVSNEVDTEMIVSLLLLLLEIILLLLEKVLQNLIQKKLMDIK